MIDAARGRPAGPPARNAPCPCGSGHRYRRCCGRRASGADEAAAADILRARAMSAAGQAEAAVALLAGHLARHPLDPVGHTELGLIHFRSGRTEAALASFATALRLAPEAAVSHYNMGCALEELGRDGEAITAFRRTVAAAPGHADAHEKLGNLLLAYGRGAEASQCFRRVAALVPDTLLGGLNLAKALMQDGSGEAAEAKLRLVAARFPDTGVAQWALAGLLREQGRFEEATRFLEQAASGAPSQAATAWHDLVQSRRVTEADRPLLAEMERLLSGADLPNRHRARLLFALGKVHDDLGEYEAAMRRFDAGNALVRMGKPFDRAAFARGVDRLIESFTPAFFAQHRPLGSPSRRPVLVLGMPRSGTTLVEQILSSHPQIGAAGELTFWHEQAQAFAALPDATLPPDYVARLAAQYQARLAEIAPGAPHVTDKMPGNYLWIGLIHLAFPQARIIHCRRHPVDTCLSNYFTNFTSPLAFARDRGDLAFYYHHYARMMDHWRTALPDGTLLDVDYEAVVADPEAMVRRLLGFVGVEWDPACLRPEGNPRTVRTASMWQARQPIYRTSLARWQRYEPWLGPLRSLLPLADRKAGLALLGHSN